MQEAFFENGTPYYTLIGRLGDLYVSYRQRFVMMSPDRPPYVPKKGGEYLPLSNRILCGHMSHKYAVCVYAGPHSSKFLCFDVDDGSRETVHTIINTLDEIGFEKEKVYVSTSGGKGYHVEIFFDGLMYTDKLKVVYDYVCMKNNLDTHKVEFRPTSGQSIKLPLSKHRTTGNICWYLDRDTLEPIESEEYILQIETFDVSYANEIVGKIRYEVCTTEKAEVSQDVEMEISDEEHEVICGDRYPNIKQSGERHKLIVQIAVHNRYRGLSPTACKDEIVHWYRRQNKDLIKESEKAVLDDIDDAVDWAYGEKFKLSKRTSEIVFGPEDFRMLAAQSVQSRRKIMFFILLCMKKYGHATASVEKMTELLGVSRTALQNALDRMQAGKWISAKKNRCVTKPEGVIRLPNTYFIGDGAIGWAKGLIYTDLPGLDRRREYMVKNIRYKSDRIEFDPDFHMDTAEIEKAYVKVMTGAFETTDLKKIMTAKEFAEMEEKKYGQL